MNLWQNFVRPRTVSEALLALRDAPAPAAPIAGGTDLLLDLDQGRHSPATTLVDLTSVAEMTAAGAVRDGALFVGAAVSLTDSCSQPTRATTCQSAGGGLRSHRWSTGPQRGDAGRQRGACAAGRGRHHRAAGTGCDGGGGFTVWQPAHAPCRCFCGSGEVHSESPGTNSWWDFTCRWQRSQRPLRSSGSCDPRAWRCPFSILPSGSDVGLSWSTPSAFRLGHRGQRRGGLPRPKQY